eukprot:TRINITY_DN1293_c0_g2_i1.p1 TRINITY_DN1293_c0_g2~~TRINITY_DN1293_c0_g2_i1.p1  ORF type:complete len:289 (-),score=60.63 TRINITY_DN1293_c0_g2_i1:214-1080(-)
MHSAFLALALTAFFCTANANLWPFLTRFEDQNCANVTIPTYNATDECRPYKGEWVRPVCDLDFHCPGYFQFAFFTDASCTHQDETITPLYPVGYCFSDFLGEGHIVGTCISDTPFEEIKDHIVEYIAGSEGSCNGKREVDRIYHYNTCNNGVILDAINVTDICTELSASSSHVVARIRKYADNECVGALRGATEYELTGMCTTLEGEGFSEYCDNGCGAPHPEDDSDDKKLKTWQIGAICAGGAVLLIIIVVCCCCRKKQTQKQDENNTLYRQYDQNAYGTTAGVNSA